MSNPRSTRLAADTAQIRRLGIEDLPACLHLAADREWPPEINNWRLLFDVGVVYGIDDPDGGLAGAVVSTPYGRELSAIGMMLVAKKHERRGLGARLMRHALEHGETASTWLSATDYGRPLYEKLGFRTIGRITTYVGPFRPPEAASGGSHVPVSRPSTLADLPAILALDAAVFGAPRAALMTRFQSSAHALRVVDSAAGIAGFGGAWRNDDSTSLGPVSADDTDLALALLADLASVTDGPVRVDVDHRHPRLSAWAEAHGLRPTSTADVMVHGAPLPGDRARVFTPVKMALG